MRASIWSRKGRGLFIKAAALVLCNLTALYGIDRAFGHFFPAYPAFLMPGLYRTNDRGYFDGTEVGRDGKLYYAVDRHRERDRAYKDVRFEKGSLQVIAIGDSFTYGQGVKLEDTYIKRLEHARAPRRIYGINLGESGADVSDVLKQLRTNLDRYKPDLIVYGYVLNDPIEHRDSTAAPLDEENPFPDDGTRWDLINLRTPAMLAARGAAARWAGRHSRIVDFLFATIEKKRVSARSIQHYLDLHDPAKNTRGIAETISMIGLMNKMAESKGSRFVVMIFPILFNIDSDYPLLPVHRFLTGKLSEMGIDSIDLLPSFSRFKAEKLWVAPSDQHPNEVAQGLAADQIERWMRSRTNLLESAK